MENFMVCFCFNRAGVYKMYRRAGYPETPDSGFGSSPEMSVMNGPVSPTGSLRDCSTTSSGSPPPVSPVDNPYNNDYVYDDLPVLDLDFILSNTMYTLGGGGVLESLELLPKKASVDHSLNRHFEQCPNFATHQSRFRIRVSIFSHGFMIGKNSG